MATPRSGDLYLQDEGRIQDQIEPHQNNYMESNRKKHFVENAILTSHSQINDSKHVYEYNRERNDFIKMESNVSKPKSMNRLSEGPRQSMIKPASKQEIGPSSHTALRLDRQTSRNPGIIAEYEDDLDEFSEIYPKVHTESVQNQPTDNSPVKNSNGSLKFSESKSPKKGVPHIGGLSAKKESPFQKVIFHHSIFHLPPSACLFSFFNESAFLLLISASDYFFIAN